MNRFQTIIDPKVTRRLFWMCWLVYFTSYLGRLNYSSAMTVMIQDVVITKTEAGFISMLYFFAYGIGQLCNGMLGDRLHPGRMIAAGLGISALANTVMTFNHNFFAMSLFWCINGYAQSMIWPPIIRAFSEMLEEEKKIQYCIDIVSTQAMGTLASYLLSAAIIRWGQWQYVFLAAAVLLFSAAIIWLIGFHNIELYSRNYGIVKDKPEIKEKKANNGSFMAVILGTGIMMIVFPVFVHGMLKDGVTSWVPTYINETFCISASFSILVTTVLPIVNLSGAYIAKYVYRKLNGQEAKAASVFFLAATAALISLLLAGNKSLGFTVTLFAVITASMMAVNTLFVNLFPLKFQREGRVSTVSGFLNSMAYLGTAFSTFFIGVLVQKAGWTITIVSWILFTAIALVICWCAGCRKNTEDTGLTV